MINRSRLSLQRYQKYFGANDSFDSFIGKIEVITNSNALVYSIRILIIVMAMLLGYIQSSREKPELSDVRKSEVPGGKPQVLFHRLQ
jgi:hypothetical protein